MCQVGSRPRESSSGLYWENLELGYYENKSSKLQQQELKAMV